MRGVLMEFKINPVWCAATDLAHAVPLRLNARLNNWPIELDRPENTTAVYDSKSEWTPGGIARSRTSQIIGRRRRQPGGSGCTGHASLRA